MILICLLGFISFCFASDEYTPGDECGTVYAKSKNNSICFLDPSIEQYDWGWSNKIVDLNETFDLYMDALNCDVSNGTLVGNVTMVFDSNNYMFTLTYGLTSGYTFGDFNVWIGYNYLPVSFGYVLNPGEWPYKDTHGNKSFLIDIQNTFYRLGYDLYIGIHSKILNKCNQSHVELKVSNLDNSSLDSTGLSLSLKNFTNVTNGTNLQIPTIGSNDTQMIIKKEI